MAWLELSYRLTSDDPGWPGNPKFTASPVSSIANGDDANTFQLSLFNHLGTHMDGPKHFNDRGARLSDFPIESFVFDRVFILDVQKDFGELVTHEELRGYADHISKADLLFLRSGMSGARQSDPHRYAHEGPGVSSAACQYLAQEFPHLRAIGMDWISLASYVHPAEGVLAHQWLLGNFCDHTLFIIEDMNLSQIQNGQVKRVIALPLLVNGIDSGPCTVIAEV